MTRGGTGIRPGPGPRVLSHRVGTGSFRVLQQAKTGTEKKMILFYSGWLQLCGSNSFIIYAA